MKDNIVAGAAQMHIITGQVETNLAHAESFIQRAAVAGVELLLLPEYFNTGWPQHEKDRAALLNIQQQVAEPMDGPTVEWMAQCAQKHRMYLCGALLELDHKQVYNTAVLVGPDGNIAGVYRKMHTMGLQTPGNEVVVTHTPLATIGYMICFDHRFPEVARLAALQKAQIILHPTNCGGRSDPLYDKNITIRARAIENGCFVIAANCAQELGVVGNSQICGPYADKVNRCDTLLASASQWEDLVVAQLSKDRYAGPSAGRRPECYLDLAATN